MEKLFKDLDKMKYGHIIYICLKMYESILILKKHDSSIIGSFYLESAFDDKIDLFFDMSNELLK